MKLRPVLIAPPSGQVIQIEDAKVHLRVDHADDDALISAMVRAATYYLDGYDGILGRCLMTQTWRQDFTQWGGCFQLPFPNAEIVSVVYDDDSGTEQTVAGAYVSSGVSGPVVRLPRNFSAGSLMDDNPAPIRVTFTSGYGTSADVPDALQAAILLHVGTLYEYRETMAENAKPTGAYEALIAPHRWSTV